jgi:hypothetical protein
MRKHRSGTELCWSVTKFCTKALSKSFKTSPGSSVLVPSTCSLIKVELYSWNADRNFKNFVSYVFKLSSMDFSQESLSDLMVDLTKFTIFWKLTIKNSQFFLSEFSMIVILPSYIILRRQRTKDCIRNSWKNDKEKTDLMHIVQQRWDYGQQHTLMCYSTLETLVVKKYVI